MRLSFTPNRLISPIKPSPCNRSESSVLFKGTVEKDPSLVSCRVMWHQGIFDTHAYLSSMQEYFKPLFDWVEKSTHNSVKLKWHATFNKNNEAYEHLTLEVPQSLNSGETKTQKIEFLTYQVTHSPLMFKPLKDVKLPLWPATKLIEYLQFWISFFAPHLSDAHKVEEGAKEV
jgi:hypothetical protein